MSQGSLVLPTTGTVSGLTVVTDVNSALDALVTANSGASAPTNASGGAPEEGQFWLDQSATPHHLRFYDGATWLDLGAIDTTNHIWSPPLGGGLNNLASASTVDLGSVPQTSLVITGTTGITSFGTSMVPGTIKVIEFAAALVLTYNATSMILPGGVNIATAAGDTAIVEALGGGNYRVVAYQRATGRAVTIDAPTGEIGHFMLATAPTGWVEMNGGTIGDASSGGTLRANADTFALFSAAWALSATVAPLQTSSGGATTRGASAAADYALHCRIVIPDQRGLFTRGLDNGRGLDAARVLGSQQADSLGSHNHTATVTESPHFHNVQAKTVSVASGGFYNVLQADGGPATSPINTSAVSTGLTVAIGSTGGSETRGINGAWLVCVKL